jgi:predicted LPLAT superfamily acyltransferase
LTVRGRPGSSWRDVSEVGSVLGMRLLAGTCRLLGRRVLCFLLRPIVLYYLLAKASARRASREYLQRATGTSHITWIRVFRHMCRFAECTLDRYLFVSGRTNGLAVTIQGHQHLERAAREGRGALLLGAHLGSFEAMRAASVLSNLRISIVADFRGSRMISGILERLKPALCELVIPIGDGLETVLRIKERIEAGEIVAVLADRADVHERALSVTFLGGTARLPVGPYLLAATLGCPVLLTFGLYNAPNEYEVHCEPFAQRITLPERYLDPGLRDCVSRYAARLEDYCRMAPDNWFNFFSYWSSPGDACPASACPTTPTGAGALSRSSGRAAP